ncbi:Scramblase-domain-containing protein [Globomyces pollinis-pini]|nr:Scramblase-domain-containing protein [Globomyces pollinis-pini]
MSFHTKLLNQTKNFNCSHGWMLSNTKIQFRLYSRLSSPSSSRRPLKQPLKQPLKSIISSQSNLQISGLDGVLSHPSLMVARQLEMLNVFLGYEQANKYALTNINGTQVGFIAEHDQSFKSAIFRQLFKTRRAFKADILDSNGNVVLKIDRPFTWFLNSTISILTPNNEVIGTVKSDWHLWRRRYDVFLRNDQIARIDGGFMTWQFESVDEAGNPVSLVDRNFMGFAIEIFTDMGQYVVHYESTPNSTRSLSLDERAVFLACAVTIDIDYFSRHSSSGHGIIPPIGVMGTGSTIPPVGGGLPPVDAGPQMNPFGDSSTETFGESSVGDQSQTSSNTWGDDEFLSDDQANIFSDTQATGSEESQGLLGSLWDTFTDSGSD